MFFFLLKVDLEMQYFWTYYYSKFKIELYEDGYGHDTRIKFEWND